MKKKYAYKFENNKPHWRQLHLTLYSLCLFIGLFLSNTAHAVPTNSETAVNDFTLWIGTPQTGNILDCYTKEVKIESRVTKNGVTITEGLTYKWTGPDGFTSDLKDITVTAPGFYKLTAKNDANEYDVRSITIYGNGYLMDIAGSDKILYSSSETVTLGGYAYGINGKVPEIYTVAWEASNGGNIVSGANTLTPVVDAPGTYTITLTHTSGCTMQDSMEVTRGEDVLTARFIGGNSTQLHCDGQPVKREPYVTLNGWTEVKEGLMYSWSGPNNYTSEKSVATITEPGDYTVGVTHLATGLTASATLTVTQMPKPEGSAGPDKVLTPDNPTVTLEGSVVNDSGDPIWFANDGGNIVSGHYTLNPVVDAPGTYTLRLRNVRGCVVEYTVKVTREEENTLAVTIGDGSAKQIDCNNNRSISLVAYVTLNGEEIKEGITYSWSGPNGDNDSTFHIIHASEPGDYTVVATHIATGATATATQSVTRVPDPQGSAGPDKVLTRENPTATIEGSVADDFYEVMWYAIDGGNIVSDRYTLNPVVDVPGTYHMVITDRLTKCRFVDEVIVTRAEDYNVLKASIRVGGLPQLSCNPADSYDMTGVAMLNGQIVEEGITFRWNSPNGYTSNEKNVSVTEAGDYTLVVTHTALNLTATSETISVSRYTKPEGSAGPDKVLTCTNRTVTLEGSGQGMVQWFASHGGNIVSGHNTLNPVVDAPGIYTMRLYTSVESCVSQFVVKVIREEDLTVSATGGQLDCASGTVQLTSFSSAEGTTYSWTGPNGYTSTEQNPMVKVAGTYTLTVADPAGSCSASTSVVVTPASTGVEITQHLIDFDSKPRGLISSIETEAGPVAIMGRKRNADGTYAPENHAAIFDSQDPTGDDTNLYTTDWGQVLIINQYQNDYPDATQWGGELILDFSAIGPVTMESFRVVGMDNFEDLSWVYLYDADGKELNKVYLKPLGMNSKQLVNLGNTRGVVKMKVVLDGRDGSGDFAGSAAIDNIKFHKETATSSPCYTEMANITHSMAYPTAFSDQATVEFIVRETENYSINLYDAQGMLVKQLQSGTARAGEMTRVEVNGRDLKEGMYFARLVGSSGSKTFKLILKR